MTIKHDFVVRRDNLAEYKWRSSELAAALPGEVILVIESFALTANNITYAVAGDQMSYWQFFPAEEGWGKIPVWGFATVIESQVDGVSEGSRYYGYFPMSSHLIVQAGNVTARTFTDIAEHRAPLSAIYNTYSAWALEGQNASRVEAKHMLFQPLFATAYLISDFFSENDWFGANVVVLTSASSKTSMGLAYLVHQTGSTKVIGLTSKQNIDFVSGLGYYDAVYVYDQLEQITREPAVIVDMAGNGSVLARLHQHFGEELNYSCLVGATHWDARSGARELSGVKPELFFAPTHGQKRAKQWGGEVLSDRIETAFAGFSTRVDDWMKVEVVRGEENMAACYEAMLKGQISPDIGYILQPESQT